MNEESLPDKFKPPFKKEKLVTQKRWMEMVSEMNDINPQMDAKEAFRRIKQVDRSVNPHVTEDERKKHRTVKILREEQLRRSGIENPQDWAYYTATQPIGFGSGNLKQPITEEDMKSWSDRLPDGLDLAIIQGDVSPGSEFDKSENPYTIIDHFWSIYVRVKPISLPGEQAVIEPPNA